MLRRSLLSIASSRTGWSAAFLYRYVTQLPNLSCTRVAYSMLRLCSICCS
jgi:hypothetical protein